MNNPNKNRISRHIAGQFCLFLKDFTPIGTDLTAITCLCTGFVKFLFPHAETKSDMEPDEFIKYCLELVKAMRTTIKQRLYIIALQEFDLLGKRDVSDTV